MSNPKPVIANRRAALMRISPYHPITHTNAYARLHLRVASRLPIVARLWLLFVCWLTFNLGPLGVCHHLLPFRSLSFAYGVVFPMLRFAFVPCGKDVRVVALRTGATVRVLKGHTEAITQVTLNPANRLQVNYSKGNKGTLPETRCPRSGSNVL